MAFNIIPQLGVLVPRPTYVLLPIQVYWANSSSHLIGWVNDSTAPIYWN